MWAKMAHTVGKPRTVSAIKYGPRNQVKFLNEKIQKYVTAASKLDFKLMTEQNLISNL